MDFANTNSQITPVMKISENESINQISGYIIHEYNGNKTIHWYNNVGTLIPLVKGVDTALTVFAKIKMSGKNSAVYVFDPENHKILSQEDTKAYIKSLGFISYIESENEEGYAVSVDIHKRKIKDFMADIKAMIDRDPENMLYRCTNIYKLIRKKEAMPDYARVYSLYLDNSKVKAATTPIYCFSSDQKNFSNFGLIVSPNTLYSLDMKELKIILSAYNAKATYNRWRNNVSFEKGYFYANPGIQGLWVKCR